MADIMRGTTPTIRFKVTNGMSVASLGTPIIALKQDLRYIELTPTIEAASNSIKATLTEEQTLDLIPGVPVEAQMLWQKNSTVIRFPVHQLSVDDTLVDEFGGAIPIVDPEPGDTYEDAEVEEPTGEDQDTTEEADAPVSWYQIDYTYDTADLDMDDYGDYQMPI